MNLKPGQQILLSTMIDGEEYFVCQGPGKIVNRFNYKTAAKDSLRLIQQDPLATEPSPYSIWDIDTALVRPVEEAMGIRYPAICYTMWNNSTGDPYTLLLNGNFMTQGKLVKDKNKTNANIVDVVFVVPTQRATTSFDPNNTMGKGTKFSAEKGIGFLGMPYREVYWLDIPRNNSPKSYTNASLVGFNTLLKDTIYPGSGSTKLTAKPGQAYYSFADEKHKTTKRTLFRLYVLEETTVSSCPDANYYFAYSQRFWGRYRIGPGTVGGKTKTIIR